MKRSYTLYITVLLVLSFIGAIWFAERAVAPERVRPTAEERVALVREEPFVVASHELASEAVIVSLETTNPMVVSISSLSVPFTSQAPSAKWSNDIFQNGCEEASLVMVAHWISGKPLTKDIAEQEIVALSAFEKKNIGHAIDTSAADTAKLFRDYYGVGTVEVQYDISVTDIQSALAGGAAVIVPTNGRKLSNPNFTSPGPLTHMLVIIGYDADKQEFITNDPGTRLGKEYRYDKKTLLGAIRDYPTGKHVPITVERTAIIVVKMP